MGEAGEDLGFDSVPTDHNATALQALKVHSIEIENYKRAEYVFLDFGGRTGLFTIGGPNESGKTSILEGIELVLGDGDLPAFPIHRGAHKAKLRAKLGDGERVEVDVQLEIDSRGKRLRLLDGDNKEINAPKTFLKKLLSKLAIDPFEFLRMKKDDQDAVLKKLDPEATVRVWEIDAKLSAAETERLNRGRDVKRLKPRYDAAPHHPKAPAKETDIAELTAEHDRRVKAAAGRAAEHIRLSRVVADAKQNLNDSLSDEQNCLDLIAELEEKLRKAKTALSEIRATMAAEKEVLATAENNLEAHVVEPASDEDPDETRGRLATVQETNAQGRANAEREKLRLELNEAESAHQKAEDDIASLKEERAAVLEAAKYPVRGLGFNDLGPTYEGLPLDQASHAHRIKIGALIGMALNPTLKMFVLYDGEKLGSAVLAELDAFAQEHGFLIIIEKFTEKADGCSVILKDGRVLSDAQAAE